MNDPDPSSQMWRDALDRSFNPPPSATGATSDDESHLIRGEE